MKQIHISGYSSVANNGDFDKDATEWTFLGDEESLVVTDGYHTMEELYDHRMALNIALFNIIHNGLTPYRGNQLPFGYKVMKSKKHHDGTMFDGYFIVMAITPQGQISYHYKLEHWDQFRVPEVERTPEWDGHGSLQVMERLKKL